MQLISYCLNVLHAQQNPDGGWGYWSGSPSNVEPTCLALLALHLENARFQAVIEKGLACLAAWQGADGAWRTRNGQDAAVWPSSLALFAEAVIGENGQASASARVREQAVSWLLFFQGRKLEVEDVAPYRRDFEIDPAIIGWPWIEDTFSWVEPTAWACLALSRAGYGHHPRVQEGLRMLLDRATDEGGINYGNRRVFGLATEPIPTVTALFLLAFAGQEDHPRLQAARSFLVRSAAALDDLESLCWVRLGLAAWRQDANAAAALPILAAKIAEAYQARQNAALFPSSPTREALTALALAAEESSPFAPVNMANAPSQNTQGDLSIPKRRGPSLVQRIRKRFRDATVQAAQQLRVPPESSRVHIAAVTGYEADLAGVVREQYAAFRDQVPLRGKRVVLKPNMVEYHRGRVINTDPRVVAAAIELCRAEGAAEVIVAEGPGHWRNTEYLVTASGLGDVLRHHKVRFIDLNHDEIEKVPNFGRLTQLDDLYFARTIATADVVISLPKLKTHHWAGVTLSLKNMFGTLPGICYGWPKNLLHWQGIENSIVDIAMTKPPHLAIVDGIVAMEGDGPINGVAKPMGVLVMGCDPLAVDATCCRLMQLDPAKVGHLALAASKKLGQMEAVKIEQIGETIAARSQPFATIAQFIPLHGAERKQLEAVAMASGSNGQ